MNKRSPVKIEGPFEAGALRVLRQIPGVTAVAREPRARGGLDAVLRFAGARARVAVETRQRANAATAWQLVQRTRVNPDVPTMLIADETTAEAREILADHGIAVIDGLGNVHVELPGLLVHIEGERRRSKRTAPLPTRLSGKAGLVAQALLLEHERAWHIADLAETAGVSSGLAHRVIARLEREGVVDAAGSGPRRTRHVVDPSALLDLWAEESVDRPVRTPGYLLAQTPQRLMGKLGAELDAHGIDYALAGTAAASLIAPIVTAMPVVNLWASARASAEELLDAVGAERAEDGENVVFLQAKDDAPLKFRERKNGIWVTNRFRLYAELRRDPRRGREQAEHLRREAIGF